MGAPRIGYVVKRFPRVSETFIAQEILQLERLGLWVQVLALVDNDRPAAHAWLGQLRAPVERTVPAPLSATWDALASRGRAHPEERWAIRTAAGLALEHPFGRGRRYLCDAVSVAWAAERLGLDHLHAHFANRPAWVAMAASVLSGLPFSFTAHAKDIYRDTDDRDYWTALLDRCAFAVTVTTANLRHLRGLVGELADRKVRLLYNGVDLQGLQPRECADARRVPRISCVARLVEKKGVDTLLDALRVVAERNVRFECDVAGDGPLAPALRRQAERLGLDGLVRFHGSVAHEQALELIRSSDVFVLPCRVAPDGDRDALPTVLLEALAAGVPCVSTPVGGVSEIVVDGECGFLVSPDEPLALADAIQRLSGDAATWGEFSAQARRRAERLFDRRQTVSRLAEWFRRSDVSGLARSESRGEGRHADCLSLR